MDVSCRTGHFRYSDGYRAFYRYWDGPRGAVVYLHGIQSHGLWFENSAQYLADQGYAVLLADRRGSGRNVMDRGDVLTYRRWIGDVAELVDHMVSTTGQTRVHLLGVSWGGKLAAAFGRYFSDRLASLTMIAPGICPLVDVATSMKLKILTAGVTRSSRPFASPLNEPSLFTDNPERVMFIGSDARKLTSVSGRFLCNSTLLDRHVRAIDQRFNCPVKLFLAGRERIIDNTKTLDLFRSWRAPVKQLAFYGDACHTLEFEVDPGGYFNDLADWISNAV